MKIFHQNDIYNRLFCMNKEYSINYLKYVFNYIIAMFLCTYVIKNKLICTQVLYLKLQTYFVLRFLSILCLTKNVISTLYDAF